MPDFSVKSPALNCTVSINDADPVVCMAALKDDTSLGPPLILNITTNPEYGFESGSRNVSTTDSYLYKIWTFGANDTINGF